MLTASCATSAPPSSAALPRIELPESVLQPCEIYTLPPEATERDLDFGYVTRGAQIVTCDTAREAAVNVHLAEHILEDMIAAQQAERSKPWWKKK